MKKSLITLAVLAAALAAAPARADDLLCIRLQPSEPVALQATARTWLRAPAAAGEILGAYPFLTDRPAPARYFWRLRS